MATHFEAEVWNSIKYSILEVRADTIANLGASFTIYVLNHLIIFITPFSVYICDFDYYSFLLFLLYRYIFAFDNIDINDSIYFLCVIFKLFLISNNAKLI